MSATTSWLLMTFVGLFIVQALIHRALFRVSYAIFGSGRAAFRLYALLLWPGVLLHELAHAITALLLGVRVRRIQLTPTIYEDGSASLGEVWLRPADYVRSSLIGAAPLLFGSAALIWIGQNVFGSTSLIAAVNARDINLMIVALREMITIPDGGGWLYLLLAITLTLLPSAPDRQDWPYLILLITAVLFVATMWHVETAPLQDWLDGPFAWLAGSFSIALIVGVPVLIVLTLLSWLLRKPRRY